MRGEKKGLQGSNPRVMIFPGKVRRYKRKTQQYPLAQSRTLKIQKIDKRHQKWITHSPRVPEKNCKNCLLHDPHKDTRPRRPGNRTKPRPEHTTNEAHTMTLSSHRITKALQFQRPEHVVADPRVREKALVPRAREEAPCAPHRVFVDREGALRVIIADGGARDVPGCQPSERMDFVSHGFR